MRERLIVLRERRARLSRDAAAQRELLGQWLARSDVAAGWLRTGTRLVDAVRREPWWLAGAAAVLLVLRPRRVLRLAASGWSLWQVYRNVRAWWRRLAPPAAEARARV